MSFLFFFPAEANVQTGHPIAHAMTRFVRFCNYVPSAGDPDRTLHAKWCRQPGARIERYMKIGAVNRGPGYTHRPYV